MIFLLIYLILATMITVVLAIGSFSEFEETVIEHLGPVNKKTLISIFAVGLLLVIPYTPIVIVCAIIYYSIHH